jgi:purine-binding chemotaxis protein CheW
MRREHNSTLNDGFSVVPVENTVEMNSRMSRARIHQKRSVGCQSRTQSRENLRQNVKASTTACQLPEHMSNHVPAMTTLLLCRVPARLIGLPIEHVIETMRPLPVERVSGAPHYVTGLSVIRGAPVPVVDTSRLLGGAGLQPERFVTVRAGDRTVALAVGRVLGTRTVSTEWLHDLPPLLRSAGARIVAAMGNLDEQLLLVLRSAHLVPDDTWRLAAGTVAS